MTFHGIGTMTYGQRDYWPDGSFVTTEWIVVAWVPIAPLSSMRLARTNGGKPLARRNSEGYYVYEETAPNPRQVVSVYCWLACFIGVFVALATAEDRLPRLLGDLAAPVSLFALGIVLAWPYLIRRWTKRRLTKEWLRQAAGLGPSGL
jgi:hypothetical protein